MATPPIGSLIVLICALNLQLSPPRSSQAPSQLEKHYSKGLELFQAGNLEAAEGEFQAIVKAAPQAAEPYFALGRIALARGFLEQAESLLRKSIQLRPDFIEACHTLGIILFQEKKYDEAREVLERVIQQRPNYGLAYSNLGSVYLSLGQSDEALKQFQKALKVKPAEGETLFRANLQLGLIHARRKESSVALQYLEAARSVNPWETELLFTLAETHFDLRQEAAALETVKQIRKLTDGDPENRLKLGLLLVENSLYDEAVKDLEQARHGLVPDFDLLYGLATAYYHSNRNSDALLVLQEALRLRPSEPSAYYLMALVYAAIKDPRVIDALRNCVAADPTRDDAWEALSQEIIKRQAFSDGVNIFREYVRDFPQKPLSHILLGEILMQQQDLPGALAEFQRALQLAPTLARAHFSVGFIHKEMGQYEDARRSLEEALRLDPNLPLANFHLADLSQKEAPQRALSLLTRAAKYKTNYAEAYVKQGEIYLRQKQYQLAFEALSRGIQIQPEMPEPYYMLGRAYLGLGQPRKAEEAFALFKRLQEKGLSKR
jgi:tetratricopeptide (TPR) repeat protein